MSTPIDLDAMNQQINELQQAIDRKNFLSAVLTVTTNPTTAGDVANAYIRAANQAETLREALRGPFAESIDRRILNGNLAYDRRMHPKAA